MNQERVKEILLQIEETELEFSVIFTGKKSKKVNGLYKGDTHEILLHNKNFSVDNELLYTAIHEYTHHRLWELDGGNHSSRVHTRRFWSYFHGLLKKAEEKGLYKITLEESPDLLELTENIRTTIMAEDGKLMKELGRLLGKARTLCKEAGVRYEDYIDRVLCLPRAAASSIEKMYAFDINPSLGYETMKVVANIGSQDKRAAAEELLLNNNSPAFAQTSVAKKPVEEEPRLKLEKEKRRLEKTIASLTERLSQVEKSLADMTVMPFMVCVMFFAAAVYPAYADNANTITMPAVPDVPAITIEQGRLKPAKPPRIEPPAFHPLQKRQKKNNAGKSAPSAKNKTAAGTGTTAKTVNGLTARTISSLTQGNIDLFQLQNFLDNGNTNDSGNIILTKILNELEKLQKKFDKPENTSKTAGNNQKPSETKTAEADTQNNTVLPAKKDAAQLIRLRINGRDITNNIVHSVCSVLSDQKDFFYSADVEHKAHGKIFTETLYFFCRTPEENRYEITVALNQAPSNTRSVLLKLEELSPLSLQQTSDILFWHYKDSQTTIELLFRLL